MADGTTPNCNRCKYLRYNGVQFTHFCAETGKNLGLTLWALPEWCPLRKPSDSEEPTNEVTRVEQNDDGKRRF